MKHRSALILLLLLLLALPCAVRAESEYAYPLFTQNQYTGPDYMTRDGFALKDGGCNLFAMVHAMQWANQCAYGDDLVKALLQVHDPYPSTGEALNAYCEYAAQHDGIRYLGLHDEGEKVGQELRDLLNDGYALVVNNMSGHMLCAVDYVICDAENSIIEDDGQTIPPDGGMFILLVDSSPASSTCNADHAYHNKTYQIRNGQMVRQPNYTYGDGNAASTYWVKLSRLYVNRAIKGTRPGRGGGAALVLEQGN